MKQIFIGILLLITSIDCSFCSLKQPPMKKFNKALTEATDTFMALQGVQAVAQGKTAVGKDCILVYVTDSTTEVSRSIPKIYKKITVELVQSDTFKTL